jgi:death-on-curing family protein
MLKKKIKGITIEEVRYVSYKFMIEMFPNKDPHYTFDTRFKGKLESSIMQPFQEVLDEVLYPTLFDKAAILFYLCVKNHPFEDGNKRMGLLLLILFLYKNGLWIECDNDTLFDFVIHVAKSKTQEKDSEMLYIKSFLNEHVTKR